jgi:hypothetical protein
MESMAQKRLSGGRRRTLRKQGTPPGKRGRPKKASAEQIGRDLAQLFGVAIPRKLTWAQARLRDLERDLIWLGEPDCPDSQLARELRNPKTSALDLLQLMLLEGPGHFRKYGYVSERALRRDVASLQKKIWGRKKG